MNGRPLPPMPNVPPGQPPALALWLRMPRPDVPAGIWRCGHQPHPAQDTERLPARRLVAAAAVSLAAACVLWSLLWNGHLGDFWLYPLTAVVDTFGLELAAIAGYLYYLMVLAAIIAVFGRLGHWPELLRRVWRRAAAAVSAPQTPRAPPVPAPQDDPALWPLLRNEGLADVAGKLTDELHAGRMGDVDHARITRAWQAVREQEGQEPWHRDAFRADVLAQGAAACAHESGQRDLPVRRGAWHDLLTQQVRVGTAVVSEQNPHAYRGAGIALCPSSLATSALVVGPPSTGGPRHLVRPVVEALCLQALAGQAALVWVTSADNASPQLPDEAFDVVVRVGDPDSRHGLSLYADIADADEASAMLADSLVGDLTASQPGGDSSRAATTLVQLLGPFQAVHGRLPSIPELRDLLDGDTALDELRAALTHEGDRDALWLRELDTYRRQTHHAGDVVASLTSRIAMLDRPAFAELFAPGADGGRTAFSPRALNRPVRVRVDLPERGYATASHILVRLLLAQFTTCAADLDRWMFACLILDDAAQAVTPQTLRGIQRLPDTHAGVLLTLRTLDEVPEHLREQLLGAVGCRALCGRVTPEDAQHFAAALGREKAGTRTVTDFANDLPPGHAVLSLTTSRGERTPPILTRLER